MIGKLKLNPKNPRTITKQGFERLKKSLQNFPEMLEKRPIVYDEDFIILGGNMRYRALQELVKEGMQIKDTYFLSAKGWTEEKKREFAIRDNVADGDWDIDMLANEWDKDLLQEWGVPIDWSKQDELYQEYSDNMGEVIYEPKDTKHSPEDLFQAEHKFDVDINNLKNEGIKELLKARVAIFGKFDFAKIADYYAYQATPEEQKIFEKLALVLLDRDKLIENGFSNLIKKIDEPPEKYDDNGSVQKT